MHFNGIPQKRIFTNCIYQSGWSSCFSLDWFVLCNADHADLKNREQDIPNKFKVQSEKHKGMDFQR